MKWEDRQQKAFYAVKQWLTTEPVLEIFQLDMHNILQTDDSNYQIGAVLLHPCVTKLPRFGNYYHQSVKYYACLIEIFPVQVQ